MNQRSKPPAHSLRTSTLGIFRRTRFSAKSQHEKDGRRLV